MKVGDYVWFNVIDDVFCGEGYAPIESYFRAGKIMKDGDYIFWVTTLPIRHAASLPMWEIPKHLIKFMDTNEAMLVVLENGL